MDKLILKLLRYLWIGIWCISSILTLCIIIHFSIQNWNEFWSLGFFEICLGIIIGLVLLALITLAGFLSYKLIISSEELFE